MNAISKISSNRQGDTMCGASNLVALFTIGLATAACNPIVLDPLADPAEQTASAVAFDGSLPLPGLANGNDPNALTLIFSNGALSCSAPQASLACELAPIWDLAFTIPSNLIQVGTVLDLTTDQISGLSRFMLFPTPDGSECSRGSHGGRRVDGTLEIISIDAAQVEVVLTNVGESFGQAGQSYELAMGGHYIAERCP